MDPTTTATKLLLASPARVHGVLEAARAFAPGPGRKSARWRTDIAGDEIRLLVVSEEKIDLAGLVAECGVSGSVQETVDYAAAVADVTEGVAVRFRLVGNPVRPVEGKWRPHRTPAHRLGWLDIQGERHGFSVLSATPHHSEVVRFGRKGGSTVTLARTTFDGTLRVTDAEKFRKGLFEGIGRGKAYGCGVLTVA